MVVASLGASWVQLTFEISCLKLTDFWIKKNECNIPKLFTSSRRCCRQTPTAHLMVPRAAQHQFSGYIPAHPHYLPHYSMKIFNHFQQTGSTGTGSLSESSNKGLENPTPKTLWEKRNQWSRKSEKQSSATLVTCCIGSVMYRPL